MVVVFVTVMSADVSVVSSAWLECTFCEDCDSATCGAADSVVYAVFVTVTVVSAGLPPNVEKAVGMASVCAWLDLTACEDCEFAADGGA